VIGALKDRVTLQTLTATPDGEGGFTETWQDAATLWARVEVLHAREAVVGGQRRHPERIRATLRHGVPVEATMRFVHAGTVYRIVDGPVGDESGRRLVIVGEAVV